MRTLGFILAVLLAWASPAVAKSNKHESGVGTIAHSGFITQTVTRTLGGQQFKETYILRNRRSSRPSYPRCRTGLFGRIVNKPCYARRGHGGLRKGHR